MQDYKTEIKIQLDWSEMDLFGHVNNVAYFKYIQAARVNYCELIGINTYRPEQKLSFAVAASSCQFKKPLHYPGEIAVRTKVDWVKNTSLQLSHVILDQQGEVSAEGTDVLVIFDYDANSKVSIPEGTRTLIEKVEGKKL
jgi:acyl-CoA thioester hydrolase